ncbi:DUF3127 domain-containing protein [Maribellus mangrovi]|uniref:DUF3127 domain-containing protein n=1 Tax=Maribellus mangrovi TaxID=3133146 RepID=UPI0030ECCEFA
MALSVKGKIDQILEPQSGVSRAGKEWKKQDFVIETDEQFPRKVCFTLFGDKVDMVSDIAQGQEVEVSFNLESREYNGRWFTNATAWKIDQVSEDNNLPEPPPEFRMEDVPPEPDDNAANDLPF